MSFFFAEDAITHRVAVGHYSPYREDDEALRVARPWALARAANPAGGIASTVKDQLRYARFHMGDGTAADGTRLLSEESIALMQSPRVPAANGEFFGVTWFIRELDGTRVVRHGGATNGQLSAFIIVPERAFAVTVLTNSNRGGELHRDVTKWAMRHYLGIGEPEPEPLKLPEEDLAPYLGRYTSLMSDIELKMREGGIVVEMTPKGGFPKRDSPALPAPPPMRAALCGDDSLVILDEPAKDTRGEFLRGPDGAIRWLRIGGRVCARVP